MWTMSLWECGLNIASIHHHLRNHAPSTSKSVIKRRRDHFTVASRGLPQGGQTDSDESNQKNGLEIFVLSTCSLADHNLFGEWWKKKSPTCITHTIQLLCWVQNMKTTGNCCSHFLYRNRELFTCITKEEKNSFTICVCTYRLVLLQIWWHIIIILWCDNLFTVLFSTKENTQPKN